MNVLSSKVHFFSCFGQLDNFSSNMKLFVAFLVWLATHILKCWNTLEPLTEIVVTDSFSAQADTRDVKCKSVSIDILHHKSVTGDILGHVGHPHHLLHDVLQLQPLVGGKVWKEKYSDHPIGQNCPWLMMLTPYIANFLHCWHIAMHCSKVHY